MKAEEMFEKLGYKKVPLNSSECLYYERYDEHFSFDLISKEIGVCDYYITMEELKAINKQCEELGWQKMSKEERELKVLRKAFEKAIDLLDEATGNGDLPCPMEYLGRCACITTDIGFECQDDTNANWEFAILEMIK